MLNDFPYLASYEKLLLDYFNKSGSVVWGLVKWLSVRNYLDWPVKINVDYEYNWPQDMFQIVFCDIWCKMLYKDQIMHLLLSIFYIIL